MESPHPNAPIFEDDELDDVLLTDEEYKEYLSSENVSGASGGDCESYRSFLRKYLELGSPVTMVTSVGSLASPSLDLKHHSGSNPSEGTEHSSKSGDGSTASSNSNLKSDLASFEEKPSDSSIMLLSNLQANQWNDIPQNVYDNFKIKSYIVEPNYFLSASMSKHRGHPSEPKLDEFLTIHHIHNMISLSTSFPSWSEIEPGIDSLLAAYVDTKDLPNLLHDKATSRQILSNFKHELKRILLGIKHASNSILLQTVLLLLQNVKDLHEAVEKQTFLKRLSVNYIMTVIIYFEKLMSAYPLYHRENEDFGLDLENKCTKQGKKMTITPDITMYYQNVCILVGEVKSYQFESEGNSSNSKSEQQGDTEMDKATCESIQKQATPHSDIACPKEDGVREHSDRTLGIASVSIVSESGPRAKKMKLTEDIPSSSSDCQKERESQVRCRGDAETGKPNETVSDNISDATSANEIKTIRHFRYLKKEEKIKVQRFLPQLFADMLAAREKQTLTQSFIRVTRSAHLGRDNESVQLGFAVEGFKLRFVRLVLRDVNSNKPPSVSMIGNANIKCDLFLTKEFNLFNKRHLKIIFQMLFAFTYAYDYI